MTRYALRRTGATLISLFFASILIFLAGRALPGDPAVSMAGAEATDPAQLDAIRIRYGLDQPIWVQYQRWIGQAVQGELGQSLRTGLPVRDLILSRIPVTLQLSGLALLVSVAIGITAGIVSAVKRRKAPDYIANVAGLAGLSVPNFWLGMMLTFYVGLGLGWLPVSGYTPFDADPVDNLRRMVLPVITLGTGMAAVLMRQMRASMLDSLGSDYVRTARAKGLSERAVIASHALRNSLITVTTVIGLQLATLLTGAVIVEQIFLIPGFGKLLLDALFQRDYPVLQGVVLFSSMIYLVVNLLVDLCYSMLNPRIRVAAEPSS